MTNEHPRGGSAAAVEQGAERRLGRYRGGELLAARYRLQSLEHEGRLRAVWSATNIELDFDVCIKMLHRPPTLADGASFERDALELAQKVAALSHPALERVLDFGVTDHAEPFLCCECLDGESLDVMVRREETHAPPFTAKRAAQLLLPVLEALHLAHENGVAHGDLKAERIFLARAAHSPASPRLLDLGVVVGDPAATPRADVREMSKIAERLVHSVDGVGAPDLDDAFVRLVDRGLSRHPSQESLTAHELGSALALWLNAHDVDEDCNGLSLQVRWLSPSHVATNTPPSAPMRRMQPSSIPPPMALDTIDAPRVIPKNRLRGSVGLAAGLGLLALGAFGLGTFLVRDAAPRLPARAIAQPEAPPFAPAIPEPVTGAPVEARTAHEAPTIEPSPQDAASADHVAAPLASPSSTARALPPRRGRPAAKNAAPKPPVGGVVPGQPEPNAPPLLGPFAPESI